MIPLSTHRQTILTTFVILLGIVLLAMSPVRNRNQDTFYSQDDLALYLAHSPFVTGLDTVHYFADDSVCGGCHGYDPIAYGMVDRDGNDVNTYDDWRTSMMANSAKDPFWRAKVSQEVAINPAHQQDLETKCTSCHAPQGHYAALLAGAAHYSIAQMLQDSVALDGVSCGACHSMSVQHLGNRFSGEMYFDTNNVIYGPYPEPFAAPMTDFIGFDPVYSEHINDAGVCASCHTLITKTVDLDGNLTGTEFVEQATYHEWLNSVYDDQGTSPTTCQGCHMPRLDDSIVISSQYLFLKGRSPYALHDLVGGNTMMLQLMKDNKETLGIMAQDSHFDETIAKTFHLLQQQSLDLQLTFLEHDPDTAYFAFKLTNKTGHKFPSGYPSRRASVEFVVTSEFGDTLFHSGGFDQNFEILGQDSSVETHHAVLNDPGTAQIYELVPVDIEGNFTTILERAFQTLKDNRIPPIGFTTNHQAYDTTRIHGLAETDTDFNKSGDMDGTGSDIVRYHVALEGYTGYLSVTARVHYQALPPKWMAPLFAMSTPEIETFRPMFEAADKSPVLIGEEQLDSIFIAPPTAVRVHEKLDGITLYPNPAHRGILYLKNDSQAVIDRVDIYDLFGARLASIIGSPDQIALPAGTGTFVLVIRSGAAVHIEKVTTVQ